MVFGVLCVCFVLAMQHPHPLATLFCTLLCHHFSVVRARATEVISDVFMPFVLGFGFCSVTLFGHFPIVVVAVVGIGYSLLLLLLLS